MPLSGIAHLITSILISIEDKQTKEITFYCLYTDTKSLDILANYKSNITNTQF